MSVAPADRAHYAHLLGLYLGDGHLNDAGRSVQLRITLDAAYPAIIAEAAASIAAVLPGARVHVRPRNGSSCAIVEASSREWLTLFPQHGRGRKHERSIVLAEWQREIVRGDPERFLRGLIQSDGCRCVNRFATRLPSGRLASYAYPR